MDEAEPGTSESNSIWNIDCWTPGVILEHLKNGWALPHDWRERLERAGYGPKEENDSASNA